MARRACSRRSRWAPAGQVTTETRDRRTQADFLAFLRLIARTYPRREVLVVLDNVSTHKTAEVQRWLAGHPRFTVRLAVHGRPAAVQPLSALSTTPHTAQPGLNFMP